MAHDLRAAIALPRAAVEQADVTLRDYRLTAQARNLRPSVLWWWGERVREGRNGAVCYLCGSMVTTWQRSYPTPGVAVAAILDHRDRVHGAGPSTPGNAAAGTSPVAEAPTGGTSE